jgi:thiol-disulfide isomerase/thioredoxin
LVTVSEPRTVDPKEVGMQARPTAAGTAAALVLAALLALSGCAAPSAEMTESGASGSTQADTSDMGTSTATPMETDAAVDPDDAAPGAYVDYTDGAIESTAGPKVLFFHASWCPQCRALDAELTAQGAPDGLTVFKVDYDSRTDLRQKYGVTLQTTVVFVDDAGEPLSSSVLYDDPSIAALLAAMP